MKHTIDKALRSISQSHDVDVQGHVIHVKPNPTEIGIKRWDMIDFLRGQCGFSVTHIWKKR